MTVELLLRVVGSAASDIHRTRNMAEDLHQEMVEPGFGTTSGPDSMTTELRIQIKHKRDPE